MESEITSRALLGQKPSVDVGRGCFPRARAGTIGLLARPTAAAVLVVINVLRSMFGSLLRSTGRLTQLLRSEPQLPSAWKRRPRDWRLRLRPLGCWLVPRTTVRGPG